MASLKEDFWKHSNPKTTEQLTLRIENIPDQLWEYQQLKSLNLSYCNLLELPPQIGQLKNLERLILNRNKLECLPEEIAQLSKLRHLDLSANQLKSLPDNIGNLSNLETLKVEYNQLACFPESMRQLTKLHELRIKKANMQNKKLMDFPLCFLGMNAWLQGFWALDGQGTVRKLGKAKQFLKIMKKCIDLKIGFEGRKAMYCLYYEESPTLEKNELKWAFHALNMRNAPLQDKAFAYILQQATNRPLQKGDELLLLGKLKTLKEKDVAILLQKKDITLTKNHSNNTTHAVLSLGIKDFQQVFDKEKISFLNEEQLQAFLEQDQARFLKEQNAEGKQGRENIKKLLLSGDAENLTLALQLIEGGGFSPDFKNELFIAYQFAVDSTIKKSIKELLSIHLTESGKKALIYFKYNLEFGHPETYFTQRLRKHLFKSKDFDDVMIVRYFQKHRKQGLMYAMKYFEPEDALSFIAEFLIEKDNQLNLSGICLKDIPNIWLYARQFPKLESLVFAQCRLSDIPKQCIDLCQALPNLKTLDFRGNKLELKIGTENKALLKNYTLIV